MRRTTIHRTAAAGLVALVGAATACYSATFDPDAQGVFFCREDADCAQGELCAADRCVSDSGPDIRLTGPEPLSKFTAGEEIDVRVHVVGSDLQLDEPGPTDRDGFGYLQVSIDGEVMGGPILSGDLASGVDQDVVLPPSTPAGLHRIEVQAHRLDGTPFANPSSFTTGVFWVDDGTPRVGIARPWPGDRLAVGDNLVAEVVALNFQFIQPDFGQGPVVEGEGHTHVYVNADFPTCLPDCLFNYAVGGSIKPPGSDPATTVEGTLDMPMSLMGLDDPGPISLTASLNFSEHFPIPATSTDGPEWDDGTIYGQFVYDTIEIELVE